MYNEEKRLTVKRAINCLSKRALRYRIVSYANFSIKEPVISMIKFGKRGVPNFFCIMIRGFQERNSGLSGSSNCQ